MQSITKKLFPTLVAVCVMSVVGSATASAYTNPILENAKGEHASKVKFTGKATDTAVPVTDRFTGQYECGGGETSTGELSTTGTGVAATTSGTATLVFKGCRELRSGTKGGEFVMKVAMSLVWLGKESEERLGWLAAIAPESKKPGNGEGGKLKFTCAGKNGIKNELEGGFVATPGGWGLGETTRTQGSIEARISEFPKQEFTKYTEEGVEQESTFWSKLQTFAFEPAATEFEQFMMLSEAVKIVKS